MNKQLTISIIVLIWLSLSGCSENSLSSLIESGELVVLTRNAPTTWYEGREGTAGPEHELITSFADEHGLKVTYKVLGSIDEILDAIKDGQGHIAAAGLTNTTQRNIDGIIFGPGYQQVQQQVVCRRNNGKIPKSAKELVGVQLTIIESSSYEETLTTLKLQNPLLSWNAVTDTSTEQLLEKVWKREIDCTLADSTIVNINRRYYPELIVAFNIGEPQTMSWVLSPAWKGLKPDLSTWFRRIKDSGQLAEIYERYYGHVEIFDYVDMVKFSQRIKTRLPKYREIFEAEAAKQDIPWTLLSAQAYQESHWLANARSPTGVRGLMMLTLTTAKSLGVKNRLDPNQSIVGGAKYLRKMIKRIPESVIGEDRLWYALASYNVGYGHIKDARVLATRLNKNPDRWVELKEVLPLLTQKKYYKTLRHGYARGTEPVRYVQRIRDYRQVLDRSLLSN